MKNQTRRPPECDEVELRSRAADARGGDPRRDVLPRRRLPVPHRRAAAARLADAAGPSVEWQYEPKLKLNDAPEPKV